MFPGSNCCCCFLLKNKINTFFFRIREVRGEKNEVTDLTAVGVVENVAVAVYCAFTTSNH